ncbi:MAG TPA: gliding motility-associated C-terminal domain-containing protein [Bacteroidales bacterium]|nr:gliding motility-associated C-terminal domain-containing protein [Bacteroidales bacterium]
MKITLCVIFILLVLGKPLFAQPVCEVTSPNQFPVCYKTTITLSGPQGNNYTYLWMPGGQTTRSITYSATETLTHTLTVTDSGTGESCISQPFTAEVRPKLTMTITQLQRTCSNGDNDNGQTAILLAEGTGGTPPLSYNWQVSPIQIAPGNPQMAIGLKARQWYKIKTTDAASCMQTDSIYTRAFSNPKINITTSSDTAYIQNPYIDFSFTNRSSDSIQVTSFFWMFDENGPRVTMPQPRHLFNTEGDHTVRLTVLNDQGCDTTYTHQVKIMPVKLSIPNIITPNGDNINDVLVITEAPPSNEGGDRFKSSFAEGGLKPLNTYYLRTKLVIFNRQGKVVYESTNYNNDWGGQGLKDGVYFYVLQCEGFKSNEVYRGSITIMGSNN